VARTQFNSSEKNSQKWVMKNRNKKNNNRNKMKKNCALLKTRIINNTIIVDNGSDDGKIHWSGFLVFFPNR